MIAYRAVAPLIEALVPPRLDHSRIGWTPADQRLTQIFSIWQAELENPDFRSNPKDLIEIGILSFRRATLVTFFLISKKGSSKLLPLLGRTAGFGLLRITLLIFVYLTLYSAIFFLCDLTDKFSKARRHAHDIPNFKIPLDIIYLLIIYLGENQSFII